MAIDKSDPYSALPRGGNLSRRIVTEGAARNISDRIEPDGAVIGQALVDSLNAEIARLKRDLASSNRRVAELEAACPVASAKTPWDELGISRRTYFNRKKEGKL